MIGAGYAQSVSVDVPNDFYATISPDSLNLTIPNGSFTSPRFIVETVNGVGPFRYEWFVSPAATLTNPEENTAVFNVSGFNQNIAIAIICNVFDEGNGDEEVRLFSRSDLNFE